MKTAGKDNDSLMVVKREDKALKDMKLMVERTSSSPGNDETKR